jgi:hypothetical protein
MAFMSEKINFRNIKFLHTNLVKARMEINFGKKLGTFKFIQKIMNDWNGKFILDNYLVERVKVKTHIPSALFF